MPQSAKPTLLDIGRALGLSKVSVSAALRGKPGVSAAVRAQVKAEALKQGYEPDPVAAELMAMVRARRHKKGTRTIAFINTFKDPTLMRRIDGIWEFFTGAKKRAAIYGYQVELFDAHAKGMSSERLAEILKARGITGVLLGPRWMLEPELEFPWGRFSSVLMGGQECDTHLHRVCNHHIKTCATALDKLAEKGYRTIGLMLMKLFETKFDHNYIMGAELFRVSVGSGVRVSTFFFDVWDAAKAESWARRQGVDALVSLSHDPIELLDRVRAPSGEKLGYANLDLRPGAPHSGINQHTEDIGAAAVDMLRGLLLDGERGTVPRPRVVLVEGEWVEGNSTPGPRARVKTQVSKRR